MRGSVTRWRWTEEEMSEAVDILQWYYFGRHLGPFPLNPRTNSRPLLQRKSFFPHEHHCLTTSACKKRCRIGGEFSKRAVNCKLVKRSKLHPLHDDEAKSCDGAELDAIPHVRTLREFPKEELFKKVVMVRFDSKILLEQVQEHKFLSDIAISTIKYLYNAGAKVILVSSWGAAVNDTKILSSESVAEVLSSILELKVMPVNFITRHMYSATQESDILLLENLLQFKEEPANCKGFAKLLSSGVDIFVNDAFSKSHRVLASTVGISRFCYASIAGFYFEAGLAQLKKITNTSKKPYVAIIGGGSLVDKAAALHHLVSICDGLVFVGNMAFQIMHALGSTVPMKLVEHGAIEEALALVECMKSRSTAVVLPKDFLCVNNFDMEKLERFSADGLLDGWQPVDLGPQSLEEITSLLAKCKKILWIGPVKFASLSANAGGTLKFGAMLDRLRRQNNLEIIVVGKVARRTVLGSNSTYDVIESASIVWEFLKGRNLPGLVALDRAYPFQIQWDEIYGDSTQPLVVDVGSGNGLFLFRMAKERKDLNFLGLEINGKLVHRCLGYVSQSGIKNGYFIRTNATSTFRSIVSSYPGQLILVSIQCPNPDFNKPEHRWRMVQRSLVESIADLLALGGKVFLQSDIEAVAMRMKSEFVKYGKGKLVFMHESEDAPFYQGEWLNENPLGVRSDWEQHVLDRGAKMYRLLLSKSAIIA